MIYILIENDQKKIKKIQVKGHSYKKNNEIDPLCASVSAVILGMINACKNMKVLKSILIQKKPGDISFINFSDDLKINLVLKIIIIQLKTISSYFKKGIKLNQIEKK